MKRKIEGPIKWAKLSETKHFGRRPTKVKNAISYGLRYEKAFGEYIKGHYSGVHVHPWIEFEDDNGYGLCQPDVVLLDPFIIFECKARFSYRQAYRELRTLYGPVVVALWGEERLGPKLVQVCRHLKTSARRATVVRNFAELVRSDKELITWRWSPL